MKPETTPAPLTDKQERFVNEYLFDQNASAAARRAGYAPASCGTQSGELMRHPVIKARIREELDGMFAQLKISAFTLLRERARAAFFDPRKLFDAEGKPIPLHKLDPDTALALQVTHGTGRNGQTTTQVRQPARHQALSALEKRYAQFLDLQREQDNAKPEFDLAGHFERILGHLHEEPPDAPPWNVAAKPVPAQAAPVAAEAAPPVAPNVPVPAQIAPFAETPAKLPTVTPAPPATSSSLAQRAVGAVTRLVKGKAEAPKPAAKGKPGKYWVDLYGKVDLSHPDVPANVRARMEEQKLEEKEWQQRRDNRRWRPDLREGGPRPDDGRPKYAETGEVFEQDETA